jgi:hypothetical protein
LFEKLDTDILPRYQGRTSGQVSIVGVSLFVDCLYPEAFYSGTHGCPGGKTMQGKSFLQAMQDVQERISYQVNETIQRMLLYRMTATHASVFIGDESMRALVTNELLASQIVALLSFLRDGGVLDEAQYGEFAAYLQRSLLSQQLDVITRHISP